MELKKAVQSAEKTLVVKFGEDALTVILNDGALSLADLRRMNEDADDADRTAAWLSRVLVRWDLTDDGEPVPLTAEELAKLPLAILNPVSQAIADAVQVPKSS